MKTNKDLKSFKVLMLDSQGNVEFYDVIPQLLNDYKNLKPKDRPKNYDKFVEWVKGMAFYHWGSRCEWEMLVCPWPPHKGIEHKVDVCMTVEQNIHHVALALARNLRKPPFDDSEEN